MSDEVQHTISVIFFWSYFLVLILGTAMTLIFLLALIRGRKILAQLCWQFPLMAANDDGPAQSNITNDVSQVWYNQPAVQFILAVINFIPKKGILYLSLLMALNRLAVFVDSPVSPIFSKLHGLFRDYVGLTTFSTWILIIILSAYTELLTPTFNFNRESLKYDLTGPGIIDSAALLGINTISDYVIPFVIVIIYIVVYIVIRKKRNMIIGSSSGSGPTTTARSRPPDDRKLLFQAIIITVFLQLDNISRVINVYYNGNDWFESLINILDLMTTVVNHSVHATIFLFSNPTIRSFLPKPTIIDMKRALKCA